MEKKKPKKTKKKDIESLDELIIIGEPPELLTGLPENGENGIWYFFEGNYYAWDGVEGTYDNFGSDRPTKPPVNP
jgi:hypothetical protein